MTHIHENPKKSKFMELAISLAKKGMGYTAPNPCVGAVITKGNTILGQGYHKRYGEDHAEVAAIKDALSKGYDIKDSTLWVTLEPCNHYGKTPPCTHAILEHNIKKVNIGTLDPNPNVKGGGAEFLKSKGVIVDIGFNEIQCKNLIRDFIVWNKKKRPYIFLKLAQTLDGKIATENGDSKWISSQKSREFVHNLRAKVDCILIGGNTFFNDNPKLTPRIEANEKKDPFAAIITSRLPDPDSEYYLINSRPKKTIFITTESDYEKIKGLQKKGVKIIHTEKKNGYINFYQELSKLFSDLNCYYVLCEGGGRLAQSLVKNKLADEIFLFIAPIILGDDRARSSFSGNTISKIKDAHKFDIIDYRKIDTDLLIHLIPKGDI